MFTTQFIGTVEVLADYGDAADASLLRSFLDMVEDTPTESLVWEDSDPPSWYLRMALRRLEDPAFGAVLVQADDHQWECVRAVSDVAYAEVSIEEWELKWQQLDLPLCEALDFLAEFATSSPLRRVDIEPQPSRRLRINFKDGVAATLTGCEQGWVLYDDNTRRCDWGRMVMNPDLAHRILALQATGTTQ